MPKKEETLEPLRLVQVIGCNVTVKCPWCGEQFKVHVDSAPGTYQTTCPVCDRWLTFKAREDI